ncbi:hypothetical protein FRB96_001348 [Tulasnella sp. 330]|nr:hypothetical protein FRB96_001348 [Tulasnella sp. 330]KAG8872209.1 hypothetical protein FRB97_007880 [Tulasnella sp. 331]KAG8875362.1 hypothetical protein FRB98_007946 [Tulasnella sp. 332]
MFATSRATNFSVCSSSLAGPSYVKGSKVLLSNKVIRSIDGLPTHMINPMNLLRGRIIEVLVSSTNSVRYQVQIWAASQENKGANSSGDSATPASIVLEVDEKDIISQLTNGRSFPDVEIF